MTQPDFPQSEKLPGCAIGVALLLCTLLLVACPRGAHEAEACFAPKLAVIEAQCINEGIARCKPYGSLEACPFMEEIDAKCDRLVAEARESCL